MLGLLDFEEREWVNFTVEASDSGTPPRTSAVPAALRLVDLNDNSPVFAQPAYSVSVPENSAPGTIVLQLNASDRDSGEDPERQAHSLRSRMSLMLPQGPSVGSRTSC